MCFPQEHDCLEIQNFLPFYFIFLASKQVKTYTKPWSNSDTLTQSTNNDPKKRKEKEEEQLTTPLAKCISILLNQKKKFSFQNPHHKLPNHFTLNHEHKKFQKPNSFEWHKPPSISPTQQTQKPIHLTMNIQIQMVLGPNSDTNPSRFTKPTPSSTICFVGGQIWNITPR